MYLMKYVNEDSSGTLLDRRIDNDVISAVLELGYNTAGSLTVSLPFNHVYFSEIHGLSTLVKVYKLNADKEEWIFTGRVITDDEDFYRTGTFVCEGILKMLCDSIVRKYEFQGTPADYIRQLISQHNSQVTEDKQFIIRALDVADVDNNNNIVRSSSQYPNTLHELSEKVIQPLGVYVTAEEADGKYMIDIVQSIGSWNRQDIRFGENMVSLTKSRSMGDIKTVVIPLGQEDDNGNRLTISSVNDGADFIYDQDAVNRYGVIVGIVEFEDVTRPENLLRKGNAYLRECINPVQTVHVKAADMSLCGNDVERLRLGWTHVQSAPHGINTDMLLTEMGIDLLCPENNTYTLGSAEMTSTSLNSSRMREISRKVQAIRTGTGRMIENAVNNATQMITGAQGGYVLFDGDNDGHPESILIMDSQDKELARNVLQLNKNGIGFSNSGIEGPYTNAWTIDGNLVADFITAGTMYADRIKGGTLKLGGEENRSGVLSIVNGEGEEIGRWDKDGIVILYGTLDGIKIVSSDDENHTIIIDEGQIKGYQDGSEVGSLDFSNGTITNGVLHPAMRLRAQQSMSIKTPKLFTAATGEQTADVTTCVNTSITVVTDVYMKEDNLRYTTKTLKFINGLLVTV